MYSHIESAIITKFESIASNNTLGIVSADFHFYLRCSHYYRSYYINFVCCKFISSCV